MTPTKLIQYQYTCDECREEWFLDQSIPEPFCPFCGYHHKIDIDDEEIKRDPNTIIKSEKHKREEDLRTKHLCPNGGWWNPVTKKCMGSGVGFMDIVDN